MSRKLSGKIALITGGSSGIGLATVKRFASEGAHVIITGRRQTGLDAAAKELGGNATAVRGDVANLADLDLLFDTLKQQKGRLDVLFANAGGGARAPLGQITEEHFYKTFTTNVRDLFFTIQKALPLMPPGSSIILNASTTSIKGTPTFSVRGLNVLKTYVLSSGMFERVPPGVMPVDDRTPLKDVFKALHSFR